MNPERPLICYDKDVRRRREAMLVAAAKPETKAALGE